MPYVHTHMYIQAYIEWHWTQWPQMVSIDQTEWKWIVKMVTIKLNRKKAKPYRVHSANWAKRRAVSYETKFLGRANTRIPTSILHWKEWEFKVNLETNLLGKYTTRQPFIANRVRGGQSLRRRGTRQIQFNPSISAIDKGKLVPDS